MLKRFERELDLAVSSHRHRVAQAAGSMPIDMLGMLLSAKDSRTGTRLSDAEVRANVLAAFFAGQETTSSALTWTLYLLSQSPEWSARVSDEAFREFNNGPLENLSERLIETRAVIDEALRLYPPVVGITRAAGSRTEIAGHVLERGTMLIVSPYVLHRHRLLWDGPDLFDPTRFLKGAAKPIDRYAYLPFGIGPRTCIGSAFALQEMTITVASVMRHFALDLLPNQTVWPAIRFTLRPRDPLLMRIGRVDRSICPVPTRSTRSSIASRRVP
jgi:cytochrome P450